MGLKKGHGQAFVVSEEEKLDWADLFYAITLPIKLRKPHLIPMLPAKFNQKHVLPVIVYWTVLKETMYRLIPSDRCTKNIVIWLLYSRVFRDAIDEYAAELKHLDMKILNLMAKALHLKAEEMNMVFEEGVQAIRTNYYPPCPQPELVTGLCQHSNAVGLTVLLQVRLRKMELGVLLSSPPSAFVINIGDILEIVTNGIYRSIEHRAIVNSKKERLSIATFFNPNIDGDLGPAPSLATPAKFKRISFVDYMTRLFSRELDGKSYLDTMRI